MSKEPTLYRGHIHRRADGTLSGSLQDEWGWTIEITGTPDPARRGYALTGVLGDPPPGLRVPAIDDNE